MGENHTRLLKNSWNRIIHKKIDLGNSSHTLLFNGYLKILVHYKTFIFNAHQITPIMTANGMIKNTNDLTCITIEINLKGLV